MASSSTSAHKTSCHTRSISFPSRPHPQITSLEDQLSRLRSSTTASTSSSSSSSICQNLGLLNELYQSFDDFLQLPHSLQALSQYCPQVEKALDGSVKLLDICSMSKEALLITKESLQNLESTLRRRRRSSGESSSVLQNFQDSRKNVKRIVSRCTKNLSKMEIQLGKNNPLVEEVVVLALLEEVEAVSLPILQSILSFVFGTEAKSSLLSKLITPSSKQTRKQGEVLMEKMDQAFGVLIKGHKKKKTEEIELHSVELIIQELEEGLDCLFRLLVKSRVSLLNLLNH